MKRVLVLAVFVLLAGSLVGCAGKTGMSFEELEQTLAAPQPGYYEDGLAKNTEQDPSAGVIAIVKARLGEPYKEQVLGDDCYLYYYVREGTAQVVVGGYGHTCRGGNIKAINLL